MLVIFAKKPHVWSCGRERQNQVRVRFSLQTKLKAVTILFLVGQYKCGVHPGSELVWLL